MTAVLQEPRAGLPVRRPVSRGGSRPLRRWAWRLFKREWRQQLLILVMLTVAVAATTAGLGVASNVSKPATTTVTLPEVNAGTEADVAAIQRIAGPGIVEYHGSAPLPGTVSSIDVRSETASVTGVPSQLQLKQGRLPVPVTGGGAPEVAMTAAVASELGLHVGDTWTYNRALYRLVGIVANPSDYEDHFALVAPDALSRPSSVGVVLPAAAGSRLNNLDGQMPDPVGVQVQSESPSVRTAAAVAVLVLATLGLLFVGLLASAGFAVMAQRRLRALGMLSAVGATERQVRAVMVTNGGLVGLTGAVAGTILGLAGWSAFRPALENSSAHHIGAWALPWWAVAAAFALAVVASQVAARWPSRAAARIPVVQALSGRPPRPQPRHPPAAVGSVLLLIGLALLAFGQRGTAIYVVPGTVACVLGVLFLAPLAIGALARLAGRSPVAVRLALRDLARSGSRSGAALAAITLAIIIAATIAISSARQIGTQAGSTPNLESDQLMLYVSPDVSQGGVPNLSATQMASAQRQMSEIAPALHVTDPLVLDRAEDPNGLARPAGSGGQPPVDMAAGLAQVQQYRGGISIMLEASLYVATPAVLAHYGLTHFDPAADVLTSQPGAEQYQLSYGQPGQGQTHPVFQLVALPKDTSAPNSLITEKAVRDLGLQAVPVAWLLQTAHPLTSAQINAARNLAAAAGLTIETRNGHHSLATLGHEASAAGVLLALAVLAMTVGLIRSETAADLRTLAAAGASPGTRRMLTAVTAAALALLGALMGVAGAYAGQAAWFRHDLSSLGHWPAVDLLVILVGLPVAAFAAGWLLAGREPPALGRNPLE